jgi:taurine dioxygenase
MPARAVAPVAGMSFNGATPPAGWGPAAAPAGRVGAQEMIRSPMGEEDITMPTATTTRIRIRPTGAALGADVEGADLGALAENDFRALRRALQDHLVLRFRGCAIDDQSFIDLARRFGPIEPPEAHTRTAEMTVPGFPEMSIISNLIEDSVAKGEAGDGELRWHTDHGFMERPVALSMLLARALPSAGGDTSFANMYQAYDELPDALKPRVAGLQVKHQASHSSTGKRRPGYLDLESDDPRELPGALHPIVRTHPETGRKGLYLGRRFGAYIPPLPLDESEALLDELWDHATRAHLTWTQRWQRGDLIVWDNRCTLHRREGFAGHGLRRLHRLMTKGERPV